MEKVISLEDFVVTTENNNKHSSDEYEDFDTAEKYNKLSLEECSCLAQTARGRLHLRSGLHALHRVLHLLDDPDTLQASLSLIINLCQDCDAALELGLKGLHPLLAKLTRTCTEESLELVYDAVQAAAAGLPPGHTFPMKQELDGHNPPPPHLLHLPSVILQVRCDTSLRLHCQGDVGRLLWPAAMVMARWLLRTSPSWLPLSTSLSSCRLLELGAGVGVTGIAAAQLVGQVTLSDWDPNVLANLRYNVGLVKDTSRPAGAKALPTDLPLGHTLNVQHLDWKCLSKIRDKYDVIIGSDIVCSVADGEAVVGAVASLLSSTGLAYILCPPTRERWGVEVLSTSAVLMGLRDIVEKVDRKDVKGMEEEVDGREEGVAIGGGFEDMLELHILSWDK